jgi:hypothetical protein
MIKIPFTRTTKGEDNDKASVAFADYCRGELERCRDRGADFDEERFKAAVDLAVARLRAMEEGTGKT